MLQCTALANQIHASIHCCWLLCDVNCVFHDCQDRIKWLSQCFCSNMLPMVLFCISDHCLSHVHIFSIQPTILVNQKHKKYNIRAEINVKVKIVRFCFSWCVCVRDTPAPKQTVKNLENVGIMFTQNWMTRFLCVPCKCHTPNIIKPW